MKKLMHYIGLAILIMFGIGATIGMVMLGAVIYATFDMW